MVIKKYYNIPSNNRELQQNFLVCFYFFHYNIPSNNRELQQETGEIVSAEDYNIPSNNRELQLFRRKKY